MPEFLSALPVWFLVLSILVLFGAVSILAGYFLWSVKGILAGFKEAVEELKTLIEKLFDKHDDHEQRLSALEGRCDAMHGTGGRRSYDPADRPSP